jgi:GWxTD domain-containing protein
MVIARGSIAAQRQPEAPRLTWRQYGLALYLIVALALLVRLLVSYLLVSRLVSRSGLVHDGSARDLLDKLAGPGAPALRESASIAVPMTAGSLRPSILLPAGWREWDREKLAAALTHELAHVRRKDALIALVAGLNKAVFWFHPLAWWLERKLALLAEEASDDCALLVLGDRCRYASTLVEMTAAARGGRERILWGAIAMARPSTLRRRIDRVLDESRRISGGLSRGRWITLLLGSAVMLCGAAALQLQTAPPPPPVPVGPVTPNDARRAARLQAVLDSPYRKWLDEDVVYIITAEERAEFKRFSTDQQRENFIEQFWLRRDPTPGTIANEFKEEHYRRIAYANDRFASKLPGWKTDRGRIYITFGPPDELESHPSGGSYKRPANEGGGSTSNFPFEIWRYRYIEGIGTNVQIEFVDTTMTGEYRRMTMDPTEKDALLTAPGAGPTLVDIFANLSQSSPANPPAPTSSGVTGDTFPMQVRVDYAAMNDGKVPVHIALTFLSKDFQPQLATDAKTPAVNIYTRFTTLSRRVLQTFDDTVPLVAQPPGSQEAGNVTYHKTVSLPPMEYRLTIVAKDLASGRTATWEQTITVPGAK